VVVVHTYFGWLPRGYRIHPIFFSHASHSCHTRANVLLCIAICNTAALRRIQAQLTVFHGMTRKANPTNLVQPTQLLQFYNLIISSHQFLEAHEPMCSRFSTLATHIPQVSSPRRQGDYKTKGRTDPASSSSRVSSARRRRIRAAIRLTRSPFSLV
jgi:hypothetical protein